MPVSKIVLTSLVRPGIEARGFVANSKDIESTVLKELGFRKIVRFLPTKKASELRRSLKELSKHIETAGIKQKFVVDTSIEFDTDYKDCKIAYDPVVDLSVVAIKKLLQENKIDPSDIGSFYLASTTANAYDPPPSSRVLSKLVRDKIVPKKVIEGTNGLGWKPKMITEGCVGSMRALEEIANDFTNSSNIADLIKAIHKNENKPLEDLKEFITNHSTDSSKSNNSKYALAVFTAANSIHMDASNPHEIINYGDGSAAFLIKQMDDDTGNIVVGEEEIDMREADKVVHEFKKFDKLSWFQKIKRYFAPHTNILASKMVAQNIAMRTPKYLSSLASDNGVNIYDFNHIVLSQTSKGVIDRVELALAEKIREDLKIPPNVRPELKAAIDIVADDSSYILTRDKDSLVTNLFRIIENSHKADLYTRMTKNNMTKDETTLLQLMVLLDRAMFRSYDMHSYTGVASIPMAIAQGVMDKKIDLEKDNIAMVSSGLGGKMLGAIIKN